MALIKLVWLRLKYMNKLMYKGFQNKLSVKLFRF